MSDWVPASKRTRSVVTASIILWIVGAVSGLAASDSTQPLSRAAYMISVTVLFLAAIICIVSARLIGPADRGRRTIWTLMGAGIGVEAIATAALVLSGRGLPGVVAGTTVNALTLMVGNVPVALGVFMAAASMWAAPNRRTVLMMSVSTALVVGGILSFAMVAPGPSMPFTVTAKDIACLVALAVDVLVFLLPSLYCTFASLALPHPQRARAWTWVSAGALMGCMADVVYPLVSRNHGDVYPTLLWCLGMLIVAGGASIAADIEQAVQHGDPDLTPQFSPATEPESA